MIAQAKRNDPTLTDFTGIITKNMLNEGFGSFASKIATNSGDVLNNLLKPIRAKGVKILFHFVICTRWDLKIIIKVT